ncbi:hypothetical protein BDB00DRAFT_844489, partial [Zychaea mexicana]|uniref:uncharacterized protein n=1 Tax=Zychaea mexicana TaxID=64656 RepID=UPI0022FDBEE6
MKSKKKSARLHIRYQLSKSTKFNRFLHESQRRTRDKKKVPSTSSLHGLKATQKDEECKKKKSLCVKGRGKNA